MLDIFATDPEAAAAREEREQKREAARQPRPSFDFQFRSGEMVNRQPRSLRKWRLETPSEDTANALAQLFDGTISTAPNGAYRVDTDRDRIEVVVTGPVDAKLVQWADGLPIHECDGQTSMLPDDKGQPCGCPATIQEKKDKAKVRRGPKPNITIPFRLPQDWDLGLGKYTATAWTFAEDLPYTMKALSRVDGDALCVLRLEHVEYTTTSGEAREFTKPVLDVIGSFNDAVAEDPDGS